MNPSKKYKFFVMSLIIGLMSLFLAQPQPSQAMSMVVIGNLGGTPGSGANIGAPFGAGDRKAVSVTVDPSSDYYLDNFRALLSSGTFMDVTITIHTYDGTSTPGALIDTVATETVTGVGGTVVDFIPTVPILLNAGETYWFMVSAATMQSGSWRRNMVNTAPTNSTFNFVEYSFSVGGGAWSTSTGHDQFEIWASPPVVPPTAVEGLSVPQIGMIQIDQFQTQPAYDSPNGNIIQDQNGVIHLPHDFDNSFADTYVVTATQTVDGRVWVSIFLGNENFGWVPLDQVTALSYLE